MAIVVVSGLGVKGQQNDLRQVPTLLYAIAFCGIEPNKNFSDQNREPLMKGNKCETLIAVPLECSGRSAVLSPRFKKNVRKRSQSGVRIVAI